MQAKVQHVTFSYNRNKDFERLCVRLRNVKDLGQIAKQAKVNKLTLQLWIDGITQSPRIDTLSKVAKVFGMQFKLVKVK